MPKDKLPSELLDGRGEMLEMYDVQMYVHFKIYALIETLGYGLTSVA